MHTHVHVQTYLQEIAAEGVSGNWFIPTARAKAVPAAATVVRHHFFDQQIKRHLCTCCPLEVEASRCCAWMNE
jgi:hypothetical protein